MEQGISMKTYVNDYCRVKVKTQAVRGRDWPNAKEVVGYVAFALIFYGVFTIGPWLIAG